MKKFDATKYKNEIKQAVDLFWETRLNQKIGRKKTDQGNRSSVTGGKHLEGFVSLMVKVALDIGVPHDCIYTKGNVLPGFFRPTKEWDLLIINQKNQLISAMEFKSQVGSFGNNFNNRTEEALGNAVDLWTAYRENGFPQKTPPWVGYLMLVEKSAKSTAEVRVKEPHYKVRNEFKNTSYLDRYKLLCQKLMLEKHYNAASIIWTDSAKKYGSIDIELSVESFLSSYSGFLYGKLNSFV
jgi:hypothetical protein